MSKYNENVIRVRKYGTCDFGESQIHSIHVEFGCLKLTILYTILKNKLESIYTYNSYAILLIYRIKQIFVKIFTLKEMKASCNYFILKPFERRF